jgi:hypothetical protein
MANYTQQQLPSDVFNQTSGVVNWNGQQYNISNPGNGTRDLELVGGGGGNSGTSSLIQNAQALNQFQIQANAPVISAMGSQIPTTQAAYTQQGSALQAQVDPLKQRYQAILDQLGAAGTQETRTAQIASSSELGKRGIPMSSGYADQYTAQQVNPITQYYAGQTAGVQGSESDALTQLQNQIAGVPIQGQQAVNTIQQAIAQLQAGAPSDSVNAAIQQQQLNQQAQQNAAQLALEQSQQAFAQKYITIPGYGVYDVTKGQLVGGVNTSPYSISNPTTGNTIIG